MAEESTITGGSATSDQAETEAEDAAEARLFTPDDEEGGVAVDEDEKQPMLLGQSDAPVAPPRSTPSTSQSQSQSQSPLGGTRLAFTVPAATGSSTTTPPEDTADGDGNGDVDPDVTTTTTLSVLNVEIDFVMSDPTPLSPLEYRMCMPAEEQGGDERDEPLEPSSRGGEVTLSFLDGGATADGMKKVGPRQTPIAPATVAGSKVQVPVMRIFGPVLKQTRWKDGKAAVNVNVHPRQNGCLHVHNAFPYMVARPSFVTSDDRAVDSSAEDERIKIIRQIREENEGQEEEMEEFTALALELDWNDRSQIEGALPLFAQLLEEALAAYDARLASNEFRRNDSDKGSGQKERSTTAAAAASSKRYLRRITVACGRPFYSYDPNPPRPFLRVEYYDPRERWKVKGLLEGLRMRCYEAHIPYTMQFFKDYNLAGMRYVTLDPAGIRFRGRLPDLVEVAEQKGPVEENEKEEEEHRKRNRRKRRRRRVNIGNFDHPDETDDDDKDDGHYVLKSNTPESSTWDGWWRSEQHRRQELERRKVGSVDGANPPPPPPSTQDPKTVPAVTRRETSCELEMDVSVESILNILDVETERDADNNRDVHWRAVPSLRELWEEERARMGLLLRDHPDANFLRDVKCGSDAHGGADEKEDASDDNVDKCGDAGDDVSVGGGDGDGRRQERGGKGGVATRRRVPGTRQAVRGVARLFTPELLEDHRRAMGDIVRRHESDIEREDEALRRRRLHRGGEEVAAAEDIAAVGGGSGPTREGSGEERGAGSAAAREERVHDVTSPSDEKGGIDEVLRMFDGLGDGGRGGAPLASSVEESLSAPYGKSDSSRTDDVVTPPQSQKHSRHLSQTSSSRSSQPSTGDSQRTPRVFQPYSGSGADTNSTKAQQHHGLVTIDGSSGRSELLQPILRSTQGLSQQTTGSSRSSESQTSTTGSSQRTPDPRVFQPHDSSGADTNSTKAGHQQGLVTIDGSSRRSELLLQPILSSTQRDQLAKKGSKRATISDRVFTFTQTQVDFGHDVDRGDDVDGDENTDDPKISADGDNQNDGKPRDETMPSPEEEEQSEEAVERELHDLARATQLAEDDAEDGGTEGGEEGGEGDDGEDVVVEEDGDDDWSEGGEGGRGGLLPPLEPKPIGRASSLSGRDLLPSQSQVQQQAGGENDHGGSGSCTADGAPLSICKRQRVVMISEPSKPGGGGDRPSRLATRVRQPQAPSFVPGSIIEVNRDVPRRSDCDLSSSSSSNHIPLYAVPPARNTNAKKTRALSSWSMAVDWLGYTGEFDKLRKAHDVEKKSLDWYLGRGGGGCILEPVGLPPHPLHVRSSLGKKRKSPNTNGVDFSPRLRPGSESDKQCKMRGGMDGLVIDENSGKLVVHDSAANVKRRRKTVGFVVNSEEQEGEGELDAVVEEVDWECGSGGRSGGSQPGLSLSFGFGFTPSQGSSLAPSQSQNHVEPENLDCPRSRETACTAGNMPANDMAACPITGVHGEERAAANESGTGQTSHAGASGAASHQNQPDSHSCRESSVAHQSADDRPQVPSLSCERFGITQTVHTPRHSHEGLGPPSSEPTQPIASGTTQGEQDPLAGIGQQGGRLHVAGGGRLKVSEPEICAATTSRGSSKPRTPITIMSIEVHVQCRSGRAGIDDSKEIAMTPDPTRDAISAVAFVHGRDPGGGEVLQILERGCVFIPVEAELASISKTTNKMPLIAKNMGMASTVTMDKASSEKALLTRLHAHVKRLDPDVLASWDTQGGGVGYIVERGAALGKKSKTDNSGGGVKENETHGTSSGRSEPGAAVDMVRLLGRTPYKRNRAPQAGHSPSLLDGGVSKEDSSDNNQKPWTGSVLGSDWDDRVGAGAAASSIVGRLVFCVWKIASEEVKHPNASYLPAMVATVLQKRIPHINDLTLTKWYGTCNGVHRWRVLEHRLAQAKASLLLLDALDVIGRAGEAARLSGVEFSQSIPGIRGSQYKVEGVLLRALQSVQSDERGAKRGANPMKLSLSSASSKKAVGSLSSTSLSNESPSQTQSPWKVRRKLVEGKVDTLHAHKSANDAEVPASSRNDLDDRSLSFSRDNRHAINEGQKYKSTTCLEQTDNAVQLAHASEPNNRGYFFYSPSKDDCTKQEALECQALTLEPKSGFYYDPVVVCDFTALYPSLVIAYNLCYSTCAGKLDYHSTRREMQMGGRTTGRVGPLVYPEKRSATVLKHHVKSLSDEGDSNDDESTNPRRFRKDRAYTVPTGSLFVAESVLKGALPQVLDELLSTRAMIKRAAKEYRRLVPGLAPSILRQLEARQLALKYVANVTYGYTSATFSGRSAMPVLADAIVECGRRTLSNAIELANKWGRDSKGRWFGAEVVYGDTDSVFVKLPGRSVSEAFAFGSRFCKAVTASNPPPVELKLEKVYGAALLQTKKRYGGMKYESPSQRRAVFEAKGLETVRRDQCALTQKILRNALVTLFRRDESALKSYLQRQWRKIYSGKLPVSDFVLTGRVRSRYRGGSSGPVQATLARRLEGADPGLVIRHKERLPYVIVAAPGRKFRLRDCVLTPMELLEQWDAYAINAAYYTKNHVNAALQRCLSLPPHRIDVNAWYESCPKPRKRIHHWPVTRSGNTAMISTYFGSDKCSLCGSKCKARGSAKAVVCDACKIDRVGAVVVAMNRLNAAQTEAGRAAEACSTCNGCVEHAETFAVEKTVSSKLERSSRSGHVHGGVVTPLANCVCIDCPVTYQRHRARENEILAYELCRALDLMW